MNIEIIETLSKIVTIDASTVEEGINQVDQLYRNEEIILDINDYLSTEYVPLDMVNVNSSKDKVAPSEVYEFVKLFWPNWDNEEDAESLSIMIYTLSDPDCIRWMSENLEFFDQDLFEYDYHPEWLDSIEHRLLLIQELLSNRTN